MELRQRLPSSARRESTDSAIVKAPCKTLAGGFLRPCQIRARLTFRLICPTEFCEIQFISQNANRPIDVSDVVRHLHVSRRLADLRFREFGGGSIAEAIRKARLKLVATRLRETDLPIGSIASACGFDNLQHLANAFRREYGMTMSAYRSGTAEGVRRALPRR